MKHTTPQLTEIKRNEVLIWKQSGVEWKIIKGTTDMVNGIVYFENGTIENIAASFIKRQFDSGFIEKKDLKPKKVKIKKSKYL